MAKPKPGSLIHFTVNGYATACGARGVTMSHRHESVTCGLCKSTPWWTTRKGAHKSPETGP